MSELGDTIIEVGPFMPGEEMGGLGMALHRSADLNELRDELIAARKALDLLVKITDPDPCDHFDHHGQCQTHMATYGGQCAHADAQKLLADLNDRASKHTEMCK